MSQAQEFVVTSNWPIVAVQRSDAACSVGVRTRFIGSTVSDGPEVGIGPAGRAAKLSMVSRSIDGLALGVACANVQ